MTARSLPSCSTMVGDMLDSGFLPALRAAGLQASRGQGPSSLLPLGGCGSKLFLAAPVGFRTARGMTTRG